MRAFRFTYPLAFLGAHLAFMPLLVLLLPRRIASLFPEAQLSRLSILLLVGGITASLAHVAAGRWSDRILAERGSRRMPIGLGLAAMLLSYVGLALASSLGTLIAAVIFFQCALNLMFAPLGALLADYVEDERKARTTAWLSIALPVSIAASAILASLWPDDGATGFAVTALVAAICLLPLLLAWPRVEARLPALEQSSARSSWPLRDFGIAWLSRLLIQCGAALVIHYLYLYLLSLPASSNVPMPVADAISTLLATAAVAGAATSILVGQISDRLRRRRLPMTVSGGAVALGLGLLAVSPPWAWVVLGYALFSAGLTAFLSLDSALVATLLRGSDRRGHWLGIMNLTNTLPAIITPALALGAVEFTATTSLQPLLLGAAAGAALAALLITRIRSVR